MTTPPPGGSGPTLKATDLRYRNAGQILLNRFSALVRIGRAYQVGNQVFRQQIAGFLSGLDPLPMGWERMPDGVCITADPTHAPQVESL